MKRLPCPSCGYDLQAQVTEAGARCPECGGNISPEDLARRSLWHVLGPWKWLPLVVVVPPLVLVTLFWFFYSHTATAQIAWTVIGATAVLHQVFGQTCIEHMRPRRRRWMGIGLGLLFTGMSYALFSGTLFLLLCYAFSNP